MGNHGDGKNYPMHRNNQRIGVAIAEKPAGPWKRLDKPIVDITDDKTAFDSLCVTNPAACIRPDGGVLLIYKAVQYIDGKEMGGNVRYGVALADNRKAPTSKLPEKSSKLRNPANTGWSPRTHSSGTAKNTATATTPSPATWLAPSAALPAASASSNRTTA